MPAEEDSTVDALALSACAAELKTLVEELHERVPLVETERLDGAGDVGGLGAIKDLEERQECCVLCVVGRSVHADASPSQDRPLRLELY